MPPSEQETMASRQTGHKHRARRALEATPQDLGEVALVAGELVAYSQPLLRKPNPRFPVRPQPQVPMYPQPQLPVYPRLYPPALRLPSITKRQVALARGRSPTTPTLEER